MNTQDWDASEQIAHLHDDERIPRVAGRSPPKDYVTMLWVIVVAVLWIVFFIKHVQAQSTPFPFETNKPLTDEEVAAAHASCLRPEHLNPIQGRAFDPTNPAAFKPEWKACAQIVAEHKARVSKKDADDRSAVDSVLKKLETKPEKKK